MNTDSNRPSWPSNREEQALDLQCIHTLRTLAIDQVQKANSGLPGTPMGAAPTAYCLWQRFLNFDADAAAWPDRDRSLGWDRYVGRHGAVIAMRSYGLSAPGKVAQAHFGFDVSFNEWHVLAITQALCDHRRAQGIAGPLFMGVDTHALSAPACASALEVLAANGVEVMLATNDEPTPTPAISQAILTHNHRHHGGHVEGTHAGQRADGIVVTPSHNPPRDGGFKYNPPHGGPAGADVTDAIQAAANRYLETGLVGVRRMPHAMALAASTTHRHDYLTHYVDALDQVIDLDVIRSAGVRMGVDPLGGAGVHYWAAIAERWKLDLTVVSTQLIDRVAERLGRRLVEMPVGFKWFSQGLLEGSLGLGGEESAGAAFLRRDGTVWTTDKDGIIAALLSAEITARCGRDPGALYLDLASQLGKPFADRIDAPATALPAAAVAVPLAPADEAMLDSLQHDSFGYFGAAQAPLKYKAST